MNLKKQATFFVYLLVCPFISTQAASYDAISEKQYGTIVEPNEFFKTLNPQWELLKQFGQQNNYQEVLAFIKKNQLLAAKKKLDDLIKQSPEESDLYNLRALLQTLGKDNNSAIQNYQRAIALDITNIVSYIGLARLAVQEGKLNLAQQYVNKALAIDKTDLRVRLIEAAIAFKQEKKEISEHILLEALNQHSGQLESELKILNTLGKLYLALNNPKKMLSLSSEAVKRYPNNIKILNILVASQLSNKQIGEAEKTLKTIIKLNDMDVTSRLFLVRLLNTLPNRESDVLELVNAILEVDPANKKALILKTATLLKLKNIAQALKVAETFAQLYPELVLSKLLMADTYMSAGKLDKAYPMYQQAYKKETSNKVLNQMRKILVAQGSPQKAIQLLQQKLKKDSKNIFILFHLAALFQQQQDNEQAERYYRKVLDEQPDNYLALNNLAHLLLLKNNFDALKMAEKAVAHAKNNPSILDTYGYILIKLGDKKKGLVYLQKATEISPKNSILQFHLAQAYVANNKTKQAIIILNEILKKEIFKERKEALALLNNLQKEQ